MQANKLDGAKKQALVAFGANLPIGPVSPAANVSAAIDMLASRADATLRRSRLWQTPAYPEGSGPPFVNAAVAFDWAGTAEALLALLHEVEDAFGRRRTNRWEARKMDLDMIGLGDLVLPDPAAFAAWHDLSPAEAAQATPGRLILPHPRMDERGFVLGPLAEVAPTWRHPVLGRTTKDLLAALPPAALAGMAPLGAGDG